MRKQKIVTAVSVVPKYELKLNLLRLFDKIILRKLSKVCQVQNVGVNSLSADG